MVGGFAARHGEASPVSGRTWLAKGVGAFEQKMGLRKDLFYRFRQPQKKKWRRLNRPHCKGDQIVILGWPRNNQFLVVDSFEPTPDSIPNRRIYHHTFVKMA